MSSSLQDIAAVKFAIVICNDPELKRKILSASDDVKISGYTYNDRREWNETVEKQAMATLRSRGLPKKLQEKITDLVKAIGMRMLTWAVYHEKILMFSRVYSIDFLKISFFTRQGIIDCKKAAEELMEYKILSLEQKYKIACLYCFTDHIPSLFKQMTKEDREKLCSTGSQSHSQPELVRFWSDCLMGEVDGVKGAKTLDQYRLEKAIQSGSKAAVEYCFEKTSLKMEKEAIVDAAVQAVRHRTWVTGVSGYVFRYGSDDDDDDHFPSARNIVRNCVPNDYYIDIVCFLLSKMTVDQKMEFLKKDIEGVEYKSEGRFKEHNRSRVLEYFLNWPYQDYFMKTAELMWEFLPEENYGDLLRNICGKIEPEECWKSGEETNWDYRVLLKEFWNQSPERYKRYVLSSSRCTSPGQQLLIDLLLRENFTIEDGQIIGIILATAEPNEKEDILGDDIRTEVIYLLMGDDRWDILDRLDRFVLSHFSSMQVKEFKRELIFVNLASYVFEFLEKDKLDAAKSAIKWSSLSEEEVNQFKKKIIYSPQEFFSSCVYLILRKEDVEVANQFIKWCISSEEEIRVYKEELILSEDGIRCFQSLGNKFKLELVDKVTNCCLFPQEKIKDFKEKFRSLMGHDICKRLISGGSELCNCDKCIITFEGGNEEVEWEEVEKFLTWCFTSEEEIDDFKKRLFRDSGKAILLNLIKSSQWAEAEIFVAWLGLSIEEIKKLKKDTVLDRKFISFFHLLMRSEDEDAFCVHYGSKKEGIELILRWCLTDKDTVFEFQDKFKNYCGNLYSQERDNGLVSKWFDFRSGKTYSRYERPKKDVRNNFDLIIEQHLKDMDEEQMVVKRKFEKIFFLLIQKALKLKTANSNY